MIGLAIVAVTTSSPVGAMPEPAALAFTAPMQLDTVAGVPWNVTVADIDQDGHADIVTADALQAGWGGVSVLRNQGGAAAFDRPVQAATGPFTTAAAVADLNADSRPDIVAANSGDLAEGGVSVVVNHTADRSGHVEFGQPQKFAAGLSPGQLAIADVDGDAKPDLVVGNLLNVVLGAVDVLINTTEPGSDRITFGPPHPFAAGFVAEGLAVADLDQDGRTDIVVGETGSSTVSVLMNRTPGPGATPLFETVRMLSILPNGVGPVDVNNDGRLDLLTSVAPGTPLAGVLVSIDDATTGPPEFRPIGPGTGSAGTGFVPESLATADFDDDGRIDVVTAAAVSIEGLPGGLAVARNLTAPHAPDARFAPPLLLPAGTGTNAVAVGDLDNDDRPDLVTANSGSLNGHHAVSVLRNRTGLPG
ncbi:hypothetical protein NN3_12760 [Nocardia neocaledoniensis NBRC 108232]|nr:hypothetical protein NN3_12760 [Nocardia neocaledoniensis NBRC 108232]